MKKFKNVKTGNILRVSDEAAKIYAASEQYVEVGAKTKKADKPAE